MNEEEIMQEQMEAIQNIRDRHYQMLKEKGLIYDKERDGEIEEINSKEEE